MKKNSIKVGQYWDTISRFKCPYCKTLNSCNMGDMTDLTAADIEALTCHKCEKDFWLIEDHGDNRDINDCFKEKGKP